MCGTVPASKVLRYQFQIECKQSRSSTSLVAKGNGRRGRGHIGVGAIRWGFFSTPPSADSIGRFSPTATLTGAAGSTGVGITLLGLSAGSTGWGAILLGPSAVTGWGAILFV